MADTTTTTSEVLKTFEETRAQTQNALVESFTQAWHQFVAWTPKVVAMLGYLVARVVARLVTLLSEKVGLQKAADRSGFAESMQHMGIRRGMPAIAGTIVFWLLILLFTTAAFNILGWEDLSKVMNQVVDYIPNLLVATVVVVIGLMVATFLRGVVATSADRIGISYAEHLANGVYWVLALLTFMAAFDKVGFGFTLLNDLILIAFGAVAVAFGLAAGLGGRDVMAGILSGYYLRQRLQAGDHVTIGHLEGTVREVGPVATIVETDEDGLVNRRSVPNIKMLNEAVR